MRCFIREKKIECGDDFLAAEIFTYTETQSRATKRKRGKRHKETAPKQKNLNDKRSKRYFVRLGTTNFSKGDLAVHLTYSPENLPDTVEEAHRIVINYLRRIQYRRNKKGLLSLKYLLVTQIGRKKDGTHRIHHHILMNGGLDRDEVENMWFKVKGTKKRKAVMYGWANADRLRPNDKGISQICGYMVGDTQGKKKWTSSQNLKKPVVCPPNDNKYSHRAIEKICKIPSDSEDYIKYWEKKYPKYRYIDSERTYSDITGWSVYLILRKRE